ncbi:S8 family serine peptidase [Allohahella sp. A8]|uniref:S8 family serine peptidase n=1 Tax=Allohahella sp. A8 TaxID=3141461 RepID=UPI003A808EB6
MNYTTLTLALSAIILTGCGGGSDGKSSDAPITTPPAPITQGDGIPDDGPTGMNREGYALHNFEYAWNQGLTGRGAKVALYDTGINSDHIEFAETSIAAESRAYEIYSLCYEFTGDAAVDYSLVTCDRNYDGDSAGHGSNVGSIIAGATEGLAPDAELAVYNIQSTSNPNGISASAFLFSSEEAARAGADIFNLSISVKGYSNAQARPKLLAIDASDAVMVISAGNGAGDLEYQPQDNSFVYDEDLADNTVMVGGIEEDGVSIRFNTPGSDSALQARWIAARTLGMGATHDSNTAIIGLVGTSQAAPAVSAAIALLLEKDPSLTGAQAAQVILDTGNRSFAGYDVTKHGMGLLDVEAALKALEAR